MIKKFNEFIEHKNIIVGGKGDSLKSSDVDQEELQVGIEVELEHKAGDRDAALDVVMDHLSENPNYYKIAVSSGLIDEPSALELAKKFNWKIAN